MVPPGRTTLHSSIAHYLTWNTSRLVFNTMGKLATFKVSTMVFILYSVSGHCGFDSSSLVFPLASKVKRQQFRLLFETSRKLITYFNRFFVRSHYSWDLAMRDDNLSTKLHPIHAIFQHCFCANIRLFTFYLNCQTVASFGIKLIDWFSACQRGWSKRNNR